MFKKPMAVRGNGNRFWDLYGTLSGFANRQKRRLAVLANDGVAFGVTQLQPIGSVISVMARKSYAHHVKDELVGIVAFIIVTWGVFLTSVVMPINNFGLIPRDASGLIGIVTMPFLHGSLSHLINNTISLCVLLALLAGSRTRSWEIVVAVIVGGGILLWLFGRPAIHIGASGLIFGLIAFLIVSGIFERRAIPMIVSVITGLLYGSTLLLGVLPTSSGVSWDGHLCGAAAGIAVAYLLTRK